MANTRPRFSGTHVVRQPLAPLPKFIAGAGLSILAILFAGLAVMTLSDLQRGRTDSLLAVAAAVACCGLSVWLMKSGSRKTLRQLDRIATGTGLTAAARAALGLASRPHVYGRTPRGRVRAASRKSASGGGPFTRIEIADPVDVNGIAAWAAADVSQQKLSCLGAYLASDKLYRIDISGVIAEPRVADFIIRLGKMMTGSAAGAGSGAAAVEALHAGNGRSKDEKTAAALSADRDEASDSQGDERWRRTRA